jgi:cytosine/adenosine deaminase-related metal-dependent hydrolase
MAMNPPGLRSGFVNAHTHLYRALAAFGLPPPLPEPQNFVQILERFWWKLDRALDHEMIAAGARLYVAEALLAGTTTLVDHHESPSSIEGSLDVLADACEALGMRALLCYGATERNRGRDEARAGLAECERFIGAHRRPLVRGLVGLHASFTVSDDTVRDAAALCARTGAALHVHVAEDLADVEDARRRGYDGPLERLLALGALPRGSILAHGIHLSAAQVQEAERQGLWLVQNPRSNEGNHVGYPAALWASERVALGTDGYPADMRVEFAALERLAFAHREVERADAVALRERLEGGAELVAAHFGVVNAEALGDRVERPGGAGTPVDHVAVGSRAVVEHGRLLHGDLEEIRARAREAADRLRARMEAL